MRRMTITVAVTAAAVLLLAAPASAHVTANPNEGPAGGFFKTDFRVGHGCEDSPTTELEIQIPEGVLNVAPQEVAGWEISIEEGELPEPVESEGETITEGVTRVTWRGELDPHHMQEFGLSVQLPDGEPGTPLWFPTVQRCEEGEHNWVTIPESVEAWGEEDEPAPYVVLAAAEGGYGDGDGGEEEDGTAVNGEAVALSEDEVRRIAADEASGGTLPMVAVVLGALGALLGLFALVRGRRA